MEGEGEFPEFETEVLYEQAKDCESALDYMTYRYLQAVILDDFLSENPCVYAPEFVSLLNIENKFIGEIIDAI